MPDTIAALSALPDAALLAECRKRIALVRADRDRWPEMDAARYACVESGRRELWLRAQREQAVAGRATP